MSYNEKGCAYYLRSLFYMITTTVDNYPLSIIHYQLTSSLPIL